MQHSSTKRQWQGSDKEPCTTPKGAKTMKQMIERMEDKAIRKYGFEAWQTIAIFKITDIMRKVARIEMDF